MATRWSSAAAGRIALTAEGEEIARRAARILAEVDDLEDYARHGTRLLTGPLRLGVIPSIAPYLLPAALPCLQERYPALELRLRESQTAVIVDELQRGALDVLVLSLPLDAPELETIRLFDDRFVLAVPASHPLAVRPDCTARLLAEERLLLLEEGHCLRDQTLSYCQPVERGASSQLRRLQPVHDHPDGRERPWDHRPARDQPRLRGPRPADRPAALPRPRADPGGGAGLAPLLAAQARLRRAGQAADHQPPSDATRLGRAGGDRQARLGHLREQPAADQPGIALLHRAPLLDGGASQVCTRAEARCKDYYPISPAEARRLAL